MSASESETLSDALHALRLLRAFAVKVQPYCEISVTDGLHLCQGLALAEKVLGQPRPPVRRKTLRRP